MKRVLSPLGKTRVAVIRGGPQDHFSSSLETGEKVLALLRSHEANVEPIDIFVDKDGVWHMRGLPVEPHKALKLVDVAWNALPSTDVHKAEKILEKLSVPFAGSGSLGASLCRHAALMRKAYEREGLPVLRTEVLTFGECTDKDLIQIFRNYLHPLRVASARRHSGFEDRVATTFPELEAAVGEAFKYTERVVVEEMMKGKEVSVHVLEKARGEKLYAFLPVEVTETKLICPAALSGEEKRMLEDYAKRAHKALGLRHYSCSRALVTPKGKIYMRETYPHLDISANSTLLKTLKATGWKEKEFIEHLLELSRD